VYEFKLTLREEHRLRGAEEHDAEENKDLEGRKEQSLQKIVDMVR
jgi:hypothetical protein